MELVQKEGTRNVKRNVISNCLTIIILIFNFILASFNLDNLIDSNDRISNLIGAFGYMILPYITIAIVTQILVLVLNIINRQGKQSLNIVTLIIEIAYFIFTNFAVTPFMFFNLFFFNNLLAYLVFLIFEILNIYIIVLSIKRIIQYKKGCDRYGK